MVWAEGSQAGIVSGCGQDAGFGIAAQPRQGGGKGQFDSASIWMALALRQTAVQVRQTAVQLVGTLRLGQGLFVAGLAVEAACQTEPQDQGQLVGCAMGGQGLAGERLGLRLAPLSVEPRWAGFCRRLTAPAFRTALRSSSSIAPGGRAS
ncbi:hypothetical protein [Streptomyces sp. NPDC058066]|uniref:hypothetical protein n=1 Tax=Streptomyces sp. NPDC058066 TaxID=3346323 RepID=UPI0036E2A875